MNKNTENDVVKAQFTAWIGRLIQNAKIDYIRKEKHQREVFPLTDGPVEKHISFEDICAIHAQAEASRFDFEHELLGRAYAELPTKQQKLLVYEYLHGMSADEIATTMGCGLQYVYKQKYYAMQQLRKALCGYQEHG